jgi:GTPase Era involved in 16S rRNA processing
MIAPVQQSYFDLYKRRQKEILGLVKDQLAIADGLRLDEVQKEGAKPGEILRGIVTKLESEQFRVLVMGRFCAGKSTFVNALFGQAILPASPTPTTGVLCVVKYAPEPEKLARLYPKEGMGKNGGSEPFDVKINDLKAELTKYVKIDLTGDTNATSRYKRLELSWPLEICRNGIELIDSVGLDDPESREKVTLEYARNADAILYLMKSQDAYSAKDKQVISTLQGLAFDSMFFIITYYDHIRESVRLGEITEDEFRREMTRCLANSTRLKEQGIKYVDSKSALLGRLQHDQRAVRESGIGEVETAVENFLVTEKGRAKLLNSLAAAKSVNHEVRTRIPSRINMLQTDQNVLEERYRKAKVPLENLEQTVSMVSQQIDTQIANISFRARGLAEQYFTILRNRISEIAEEYEIQTSILGLPPRIKPVVEEVLEHLKSEIGLDMAGWSQTTVQPMVEERVKNLEQSLQDKVREFAERAHQIRIQLSMGTTLTGDEVAKAQQPTGWEKAVGLVYALGTGDFLTGATGMLLGIRGFMTTIAYEVAAGVILGVFGLLNPVALVIASLAAISAGGFTNVFTLKRKIKKMVGEKLAAELDNRKSELCDMVQGKVVDALQPIRSQWDKRMAGELASLRGEAENAIELKKKGQAAIEQEVALIRDLAERNNLIDREIDEIVMEADLLAKA